MANYVPARVATAKLGVSLRTLLRWEEAGKIQTIKTPNGQRRYNIDSILNPLPTSKPTILYARVSSYSQKTDLERQVEFLLSHYPECEVIRDIGSGLSFKRKGLLGLLERILSGDVGRVVVTNKDRLCRFGYDLIAWLLARCNCEILVLNNHLGKPGEECSYSPEREMLEDFQAILHIFSRRLSGLRKYKTNIKEDPDLQGICQSKNRESLEAAHSRTPQGV
ncbi:IS607 family transposase [Kamptonema formosum]|uniref:IS607 family transposase n=1 Tax=Kamptonema formosum TaxID=331992 RepID=UPI00034A2B7F|nr:IS607 family transposase [Oscillatoria sp. PCC 10802]